jgi:hypothetical protein
MSARAALAAVAAACVLAAGCGPPPATIPAGIAVEGVASRLAAAGGGAPASLVGPFALPVPEGAPSLVAVRLVIVRGAVDCVVSDGATELARRRVERLGDDLVVLAVRATGAATLTIAQAPKTGPLDAELRGATLYAVSARTASAAAGAIAEAFERETGRSGDPAVENLVANPDFAADDEVRGTPADWYAYVDTAFDPATHALHVEGPAPARRPFLATGPVKVEAGRRYRATWRMAVARGTVVVRGVDYDELATVFAEPPVDAGGPIERSLEFIPPAGCRAVRLRFEGTAAGVDTAFDVSIVQIEALPDT